jgi:hypothetical protein
VNSWDAAQVNRIVGRLEFDPGFPNLRSLAIVGGAEHRSALLATSLINVSAFAANWAKLGLIEAWSGYRFAAPDAAEMEVARAYCANSDIWPASNSVRVAGTLAVVCLTKTPAPW